MTFLARGDVLSGVAAAAIAYFYNSSLLATGGAALLGGYCANRIIKSVAEQNERYAQLNDLRTICVNDNNKNARTQWLYLYAQRWSALKESCHSGNEELFQALKGTLKTWGENRLAELEANRNLPSQEDVAQLKGLFAFLELNYEGRIDSLCSRPPVTTATPTPPPAVSTTTVTATTTTAAVARPTVSHEVSQVVATMSIPISLLEGNIRNAQADGTFASQRLAFKRSFAFALGLAGPYEPRHVISAGERLPARVRAIEQALGCTVESIIAEAAQAPRPAAPAAIPTPAVSHAPVPTPTPTPPRIEPTAPALAPAAPPAVPASIKLVTFNMLADAAVRSGAGASQFGSRRTAEPDVFNAEQRARRNAGLLETYNADIYCLQEVDPASFSLVQARLASTHDGFYQANLDNRYGCAIFVRKGMQLEGDRTTPLALSGLNNKIVQIANVIIPTLGRTLNIANVHLDMNQGSQQLQMIMQARQQRASRNEEWVVAGDCNMPSTQMAPHLPGFSYRFTNNHPTQPSTVGMASVDRGYHLQVIDHVFHTNGIQSETRVTVPYGHLSTTPLPDNVIGSDHVPVMSTLTFTQPASATVTPAVVSSETPFVGQIRTLASRGYVEFYGQTQEHDPVTWFLGNFFPVSVTVNGIRFTCAEAAFQAGKFADRPAIVSRFQGLNGQQAYDLARNLENGTNGETRTSFVSNWRAAPSGQEAGNVQRMRAVLRAKFQDGNLRQWLLATGNAHLMELTPVVANGLPRDGFWGAPRNMLGYLIMQVRGELGGASVVPPPRFTTSAGQTLDPTNTAVALGRAYHAGPRPPVAPSPAPTATLAAPLAAQATTTSSIAGAGTLLRLPTFNSNATTAITVTQGDIVTQRGVDAIVNAANPQLTTGGGVSGAIFTAAGSGLDVLCRQALLAMPGRQLGTALSTVTGSAGIGAQGGAQRIIHSVAPLYNGASSDTINESRQSLYQTYFNLLEAARVNGIRSIALPALGTLNYGFPLEDATHMQRQAIKDYLARYPTFFSEIRLVYYTSTEFQRASGVLLS